MPIKYERNGRTIVEPFMGERDPRQRIPYARRCDDYDRVGRKCYFVGNFSNAEKAEWNRVNQKN